MKVGIDLGTTNSALAWIDPAEAEDTAFPPIHIFEFRNWWRRAAWKRGARCLRFCFWKTASRWGPMRGSRARWCRRGWCTRRRPGSRIRKWIARRRFCRGIAGDGARVVAGGSIGAVPGASCARRGMNGRSIGPLAEQDIVLTVPASFDEEARELTVMAANEAGLEK